MVQEVDRVSALHHTALTARRIWYCT